MAEGPVELTEQPRMRRDDHAQHSSRREQLGEPREHRVVVRDVLEDVEADDRVERPFDAPRVSFDDLRPRYSHRSSCAS